MNVSSVLNAQPRKGGCPPEREPYNIVKRSEIVKGRWGLSLRLSGRERRETVKAF